MDDELQLVLAEAGINRVLQRYSRAMDTGDEAGWVACFTEDAVMDVRKTDGTLIHREEGHQDLARYVAQYPKPPNFRKHIYCASVIDADPKQGKARVESHWVLLASGPQGEAVLSAFGSAKDVLVRTPKGWLIQERVAVAEAM